MKCIHFLHIPACSPHWVGVYERLIGLTKTSLKKVLGRSLATLQELCALIKEIQAILNDHPLTTLTSDINDLQPLKRSHLLFRFLLIQLDTILHSVTPMQSHAPNNVAPFSILTSSKVFRRNTYHYYEKYIHIK